MLSQLVLRSLANFGKSVKKVKTVWHRRKHYAKFPDKFKLVTLIRPPDLTQPNIIFPIRIPIRYRHIMFVKKQLVLENTQKIHWNRLQPNQILLALQNIKYMSFSQMIEGLKYLSEIKGQEEHDWNKHEWVSSAFNHVKQNMKQLKKKDLMRYYYLFKKLKYSDEGFWKKMYGRIERNIYDLSAKDFSYIYLTYYDKFESVFSAQARKNFEKLMEGRLRQLTSTTIIQIFQFFLRDKKLDNYWLENVFISLFKQEKRSYTAKQIVKIFRSMMHLNHEINERLYVNLYKRIENLDYQTVEETEQLQEVLLEVKEIFKSHRVDYYLEFIQKKKNQLKEKKVDEKKKTIEQMVRDDLKYFMEKKKLKALEKGVQSSSSGTDS